MADLLHEDKDLEELILDAKRIGLRFRIVEPHVALIGLPNDTMAVMPNWTDYEFKIKLNDAINRINQSSYLTILRKHNLV